MSLEEDAINLHRMLKGKIEIHNRISVDSTSKGKNNTLDLIYTPGVAFVAKEISTDKELAYDYTSKWNNVAIVCDGTRVLGLGNIGPEGAIPVMEGKSVLFRVLGGINAFPLCIDTKDKDNQICKNNTTHIWCCEYRGYRITKGTGDCRKASKRSLNSSFS